MSFVKYLTVMFSIGLPAKINDPFPASSVRFQQFRVIERFCAKGSNKGSDRRGTLVIISKFLMTVHLDRTVARKFSIGGFAFLQGRFGFVRGVLTL